MIFAIMLAGGGGGFLPKGNRVVERRYKTVIWQKDDEHCVSYVVAVAGQNLTAHIEPECGYALLEL